MTTGGVTLFFHALEGLGMSGPGRGHYLVVSIRDLDITARGPVRASTKPCLAPHALLIWDERLLLPLPPQHQWSTATVMVQVVNARERDPARRVVGQLDESLATFIARCKGLVVLDLTGGLRVKANVSVGNEASIPAAPGK
jgi:hypothetical protein